MNGFWLGFWIFLAINGVAYGWDSRDTGILHMLDKHWSCTK